MLGTKYAKKRTGWVALLAVYALLVQTLFSAYALGASVDPLAAGPLCGPLSVTSSPFGKDTPVGHQMPDCCLAGCPMFAAALPPPAAPQIAPDALIAIAEGAPPHLESDGRPRPGTPRHPRAPPPLA